MNQIQNLIVWFMELDKQKMGENIWEMIFITVWDVVWDLINKKGFSFMEVVWDIPQKYIEAVIKKFGSNITYDLFVNRQKKNKPSRKFEKHPTVPSYLDLYDKLESHRTVDVHKEDKQHKQFVHKIPVKFNRIMHHSGAFQHMF